MNEVVQVRMSGWAAMVKQKKESGMTVKEWCAANGITEHAYYYRLRQLRKGVLEEMQTTAADSYPQFHKVEKSKAAAGVGIRIRRGETVIEIDNQASDPLLAFLKEVLIHAV